MSYLALRTLADTNPEFRTILLRLAQEVPVHPIAQESRDALLVGLGQGPRPGGKRPTLKPVPPSGSGA
jgi:hypothetical protein